MQRQQLPCVQGAGSMRARSLPRSGRGQTGWPLVTRDCSNCEQQGCAMGVWEMLGSLAQLALVADCEEFTGVRFRGKLVPGRDVLS